MKPITVIFSGSIQRPAKLGTLILKRASEGNLAYAQNVDVNNDEYGIGVALPGPALTTITNNSELTGVPFIYAKISSVTASFNNVIFAEGLLGATNKLRSITGFKDTGTASIETAAAASLTVTHNDGAGNDTGHTGIVIEDMVIVGDILVMIGYDATDTFIQKLDVNHTGSNLSLTGNNFTLISAVTSDDIKVHHLALMEDGAIYGNRSVYPNNFIWKVASDLATYSTTAITLPDKHYITAIAPWRKKGLFAWTSVGQGEFDQRNVGGKCGVLIWDLIQSSFDEDIICPANYISAIVGAPDGNLLIFGGVNEGRSTIYGFTGYGFVPLVSYIGDLPRNAMSVDFDGQGRVIWITADGQLCRYDRVTDVFEHLGSITTASDAGGILTKFNSGTDFIAASGSGSTYTLKRVLFGSFLGDDAAGTDGVTTPLAVSGIQVLPQGSNITAITLHLAKNLATSEKVELRVYKNGSTTPTTYMTMSFADDGAISSKREVITLDNINSFSLAVAWKQTDGLATAAPVLAAEVEVSTDKG